MSKLLEQISKERKSLGSLLEITSSKRIYLSEYKDCGVPFFRSKEIIEASKGRDISSELYISNERYEEVKNKFGVPQIGDILLTSIGTIGIPFIVKDNTPFYFKDGNLTWFRNYNGIDPSFLYYWIVSPIGQSRIESSSIGSSQSALTIDSIKKLQIDLPDLPIQKKIASILSAYDEKIDNNNRVIKNLETTAQTIFNEWFVNFRFPGYEKVKMVNSEMGEIPEGWVSKKISEFCQTYGGGTPSTKESSYWDDAKINWVTPTDMTSLSSIFIDSTAKKISQAGLENSSTRLLPAESILMTSRATVGVLAISKVPITTNQGFIACVCEQEYETPFLFWWLKSNISLVKGLATGSTFPEISRGVFREIEILVPPEKILFAFNKSVSYLHQSIYLIDKENTLLKRQKDTLLAKII